MIGYLVPGAAGLFIVSVKTYIRHFPLSDNLCQDGLDNKPKKCTLNLPSRVEPLKYYSVCGANYPSCSEGGAETYQADFYLSSVRKMTQCLPQQSIPGTEPATLVELLRQRALHRKEPK